MRVAYMYSLLILLVSSIALIFAKNVSHYGIADFDEIKWFTVETKVGQQSLVEVYADGCGGLTTLLAKFGGLSYPSDRDLIIPLEIDSSGSCTVSAYTTSAVREGLWFFGLTGGLPLQGSRFFSGDPDQFSYVANVDDFPIPVGSCCINDGIEESISVIDENAILDDSFVESYLLAQPVYPLYIDYPMSFVGLSDFPNGQPLFGSLKYTITRSSIYNFQTSFEVCAVQGRSVLPGSDDCSIAVMESGISSINGNITLSPNLGVGPWHVSVSAINGTYDAIDQSNASNLNMPEWIGSYSGDIPCVCGNSSDFSLQLGVFASTSCSEEWSIASYGAVDEDLCTQRVFPMISKSFESSTRMHTGDLAVLAPFLSKESVVNSEESCAKNSMWHTLGNTDAAVQWEDYIPLYGDGPIGSQLSISVLVSYYDESKALQSFEDGAWNMGFSGKCQISSEFSLTDVPLQVAIDFDNGAGLESVLFSAGAISVATYGDSVQYFWSIRPPPLVDSKMRIRIGLAQNETYSDFSGDWALMIQPSIEFSRCNSYMCPSDKGSCYIVEATEDGIITGVCDCIYGWGGETCEDRVLSPETVTLQTTLLVLSNLAIVPSVVQAYKLRHVTGTAAGPGCTLAIAGFASGWYHLCDMEVYCVANLEFSTLAILDKLFSYMSSAVLGIYMAHFPKNYTYLLPGIYAILYALFTLASSSQDIHAANVICAIGFVLIIIAFSWSVKITKVALNLQRNTKIGKYRSFVRALYVIFFMPRHFNGRMICMGFVSVATGILFFAIQDRGNYALLHSCWHVFSMGSTYFFLRARCWTNPIPEFNHGSTSQLIHSNCTDMERVQRILELEADISDL